VKKNFTVGRVKSALLAIREQISEPQMAMLRAHYYHRTLSMQEIAVLGGYKQYRIANLQYGHLCKRIADQMGFVHRCKTYAIATGSDKDSGGQFQWQMDDVVVKALRQLRWFSARPNGVRHTSPDSLKDQQTAASRKPMTRRQLRAKIYKLRAQLPLTNLFEALPRENDSWGGKPVWYNSQRQHWLGWVRRYNGRGAYGRKKWRRTAEFVYNHIVCPPMVLWLGEACGVPNTKIYYAMQAALRGGPTLNHQVAAIRKVIPWELIEARLNRGTRLYPYAACQEERLCRLLVPEIDK
jgi:hypothetical protein